MERGERVSPPHDVAQVPLISTLPFALPLMPWLGMAPRGALPMWPIAVPGVGPAFRACSSTPAPIAPAGPPSGPYQPPQRMKATINTRERDMQHNAKKKHRTHDNARVAAQLANATARLSLSEQAVEDAHKSATEALRELPTKEFELEQLRQEVERLRGDVGTNDGNDDDIDESLR